MDAAPEPSSRPSRWEIECGLAQIWRDALDIPSLKRNDDFFTLGGDSVAATKVITAIEEIFNLRLPMSALVENPTVGLLAARINTSVDVDESGLLVPVRTSGDRPPLFLVHGLMGHVVFAHILAKYIGADQPLYAFRAKGFDGQPPHPDVETMAKTYLALIREVQPHGPYYIGGNCSGSVVALEMCRMLRNLGEPVGLMLAIDPLEPAMSFTNWRLRLGPLKPDGEHALAFQANLRHRLQSEIYGHGGIAAQRLDWATQVATALDVAFARHQPAPYTGTITVIASEERAADLVNPKLGWRKIVAGEMRIHVAAKRHITLFLAHGQQIAKLIRLAMDRVRQK
ncbi:MAG TPA: thioesterase domain-containing protein [Tepidisphaeraceae bacterium]|jgi:thioesterase domain-containing protein/acyl carrier protein|nr:thioesterase domain-containing protein [Tepidisphaeraceae bacterium]